MPLFLTRTQVININDFGADPTGIRDSTIAIQNAINAAQSLNTGTFNSVGGTVYVPSGMYKIMATLSISWPIAFIGSGWGSIIQLANNSNASLFAFTPTNANWMNGVRFSYLKLDGNGANQSAGDIIDAKGAVWCLFDHVWFRNPYGNGIHLHDDNLGGFGHHNMVSHCLFDNGQSSNGGDGRGVYITNCDENMICNSTFQDCGRAAASEPNAYYETSGLNSVANCQFVGGATGIKFQGSRSIAANNRFDGCKNHNIRLNGNSNSIIGNHFYNLGAGSSANSVDGMWIDNVQDNQIATNLFHVYNGTNGSRYFINLTSGPATNTLISSNNMSNIGGGTLGTGKIGLSGNGHMIRGNPGLNPAGPLSAPSIPTSGTALTNNTGYDCSVFVSGGTITAPTQIGSVSTGQNTGLFRIPAGQTITLTYSSVPSWSWFGD